MTSQPLPSQAEIERQRRAFIQKLVEIVRKSGGTNPTKNNPTGNAEPQNQLQYPITSLNNQALFIIKAIQYNSTQNNTTPQNTIRQSQQKYPKVFFVSLRVLRV